MDIRYHLHSFVICNAVFHSCDDQIELLDEAQGAQEDGVDLPVTEVLLQSSGEALGTFDKLAFTLLESFVCQNRK